jgi:lipopolysaccharide export system protein LptA
MTGQGLWFVTDVETSETVKVTEGGRGSEDVGGGFGSSAVQAVRKSLTQRVQIDADDLKRQIGNLTTVVGDVFDQTSGDTGLTLDQVELSIEVSSEGQVSILGTGGKLEGKGGIKLSFKRNPAKA